MLSRSVVVELVLSEQNKLRNLYMYCRAILYHASIPVIIAQW